MNFNIRQSRAEDRPTIFELVESAFGNVPESDHREQYLVERLHESAAFVPQLSLVAESADGRVVGYILLTEVEIVSDSGVAVSLGVAPLAVAPEFQRRGVGGALIAAAHRAAAALGYGSAVLPGHEDYYPSFGYRRAADYGIEFPFDAPSECCMAIELRYDALKGVRGTVRYPDVFFE